MSCCRKPSYLSSGANWLKTLQMISINSLCPFCPAENDPQWEIKVWTFLTVWHGFQQGVSENIWPAAQIWFTWHISARIVTQYQSTSEPSNIFWPSQNRFHIMHLSLNKLQTYFLEIASLIVILGQSCIFLTYLSNFFNLFV